MIAMDMVEHVELGVKPGKNVMIEPPSAGSVGSSRWCGNDVNKHHTSIQVHQAQRPEQNTWRFPKMGDPPKMVGYKRTCDQDG